MTARRLLVVGGGPAGMSAAVAAAERGVASTLVDEGFDLGGQIWRPPTRPEAAPPPDPRGESLRAVVASHGERSEVRWSSAVWGIFSQVRRAAVSDGARTEVVTADAMVLAPGAHERVPPFPGWTLPGVMTPGAAQILLKTMGVAPGARVVVAGTGPFLLVVACQLVAAGVSVAVVLEAARRAPWLALPLRGWRTPGLLRDGAVYLARLARAGVPVRYGRVVVAAEGTDRVRSVLHAPADRDWRPDSARAERVEADALLVGFGFVPRVQLAQSAGCRLEHRDDVGGWVPARDADLMTTVPGVFAAGDGAGVAGVLVAAAEGRLAGLAAAARLGAIDARELAAARAPLDRELARLAPIRRALDRICALRPGLESLVADDTVVCRCEEVTWREARDAVRAGCGTYRSLKVATRLGMGACQGAFCWPSLARLVAAERAVPVADVGPASARPPVRPVSLGEMAAASPAEGGR